MLTSVTVQKFITNTLSFLSSKNNLEALWYHEEMQSWRYLYVYKLYTRTRKVKKRRRRQRKWKDVDEGTPCGTPQLRSQEKGDEDERDTGGACKPPSLLSNPSLPLRFRFLVPPPPREPRPPSWKRFFFLCITMNGYTAASLGSEGIEHLFRFHWELLKCFGA